MKKIVSIAALCFFMSMQFMAQATSPCTTSFALNYALAERALSEGLLGCKQALLEGPCTEEVKRSHNTTVNNLYTAFSECCCATGLAACCN